MSTLGWLLIMFAVYLIRAVMKGQVLDKDGNFILPRITEETITALITGDTAKLKELNSGTPGAGISMLTPTAGDPVPKGIDPVNVAKWDKLNPRTVAGAMSWAQGQTTCGVGTCEAFTTHAYGHSGGFPTAIAHWLGSGEQHTDGTIPPAGALVFWRTKNSAGHTALSMGGGMVRSTDFNGTNYTPGEVGTGPISAIDNWGPRLGWTPPDFRRYAGSGQGA